MDIRKINLEEYPNWYQEKIKIFDKFKYHLKVKKMGKDVSLENYNLNTLKIGYSQSLELTFMELVETLASSIGANLTASNLDKKYGKSVGNHWRVFQRDREMKNFIIKYYNFLDYLVFMISEITNRSILKKSNSRGINFNKIKSRLKKLEESDNLKVENINLEDIKKLNVYFSQLNNSISIEGQELLKKFRNIITHRYNPGISYLTVKSEIADSDTRAHTGSKVMQVGDYSHFNRVEFEYVILQEIAEILLKNLHKITNDVLKLDFLK